MCTGFDSLCRQIQRSYSLKIPTCTNYFRIKMNSVRFVPLLVDVLVLRRVFKKEGVDKVLLNVVLL